MPEQQPVYSFDRVVRMVLSAVTLVAVFLLLRYLSDVLLPFAAAVVLAYLLNPLVTVFERKTKRRGLAVGLTIGGLLIVGLAMVAIVVPVIVSQVSRFQADLGKLRDDLAASVSPLAAQSVPPPDGPSSSESPDENAEGATSPKSVIGYQELMKGWSAYRQSADEPRRQRLATLYEAVQGTYIGDFVGRAIRYAQTEEFDELLLSTAKRLAIGGWTVVAFAVNLILALTGLIVVLIYLVFLLLDYPEYARTWPTFLPPGYRESIVEFLQQFDIALRRYFRGQSVVALLVGTLFVIGFTLIGLPMALPFGLFVGMLNMVPYLQTVGLVPAMLLAGLRTVEADSSFVGSVLLTLLVFAVVQIIQDAVITPRIMGKATGLRPVAILLGIFIWGKLLGFLGLLLAIPLTCLGIAYYRRFVLRHVPETTKLVGGD